ncbi:hypothetical protein H8E77_35085 [bacterium]|nr:hypothetical protein [bacterium]
MSQEKHTTIIAVSEGWEDAYIKDDRIGKIYYVRAPYFKKQEPIEETVLHSSMAYGLIVPEIKDFPSLDAVLEYVRNQYETQDDNLTSLEDAVDVILNYAKEINHPLADKAVKNLEKREEQLIALLNELEVIRQEGESILAAHAAD